MHGEKEYEKGKKSSRERERKVNEKKKNEYTVWSANVMLISIENTHRVSNQINPIMTGPEVSVTQLL